MADLNYVSPLTSDLTDYYTKTEVDELQQGDENRFATQAQITAGDNEVKGWVASQGYLTQHQSLQNYATKEYVDAAIEDIEVEGGVKIRVVSNLPANPETNVIYLTRRSSEEDDNVYNEWIYVEDIEDFELIGDTSTGVMPDLTNYATKSYVDTAVGAIVVPDVSDFIDAEKAASIAADEVEYKMNTLSTVAVSGSYDDLTDKPTIPAAPDLSSYATKSELSAKANAADLATVATSGSYNDLSNKPTIPSTSGLASETYVDNAIAAIKGSDIDNDMNWVDEPMAKAFAIDEINNNVSAAGLSGDYDDLTNKPTIPTVPTNVSSFTNDAGYLTSHQDISGKANIADLATVATTGDYDDLTNKPTIPVLPTLATVATSGSYNDLSDKPTIPSEGLSQILGDNFFKLFAFQSGQNIQTTAYVEVSNSSQVSDAIKKGLIFVPTVSQIAINYPDFTTQTFVEIYNYYNGDFDSRRVNSPYVWSGMAYVRVGDNTLLGWNIDTSKINKVEKLRTSILKAFTKYQPYINTTSGLTATTVQAAIDELAAASGGGASTAAQLSYDNTNTWNDGTDTDTVQEAIDSLYADVDGVSQRVDGVERSIADLPAGYEISETYDDRNKSLTLSVVESSGR